MLTYFYQYNGTKYQRHSRWMFSFFLNACTDCTTFVLLSSSVTLTKFGKQPKQTQLNVTTKTPKKHKSIIKIWLWQKPFLLLIVHTVYSVHFLDKVNIIIRVNNNTMKNPCDRIVPHDVPTCTRNAQMIYELYIHTA